MAEHLQETPLAPRTRAAANGSGPAIPRAPAGLSASSRRLWKEINETWILDAGALPLLVLALECLDRYTDAAAQIKRDGPTIYVKGAMRVHPAHAPMRDNLREARQLFRQLNLAVDTGVDGA